MKRIILMLVFLFVLSGTQAYALLGSGVPDLNKFKGKNKVRQTLICIDLSMMKQGDTNWAKRINSKLVSSLMPAETVTVVALDTVHGVAEEIWSGFWPDYSRKEKDEIENSRTIVGKFFSKDPLSSLNEEQKFFRKLLGGALGRVYGKGLEATQSKANKLMRALASDEDRFNKAGMVSRVFLYSSMDFKPLDEGLSLDFGNSVFYIFGVNMNHEMTKDKWEAVFQKSHGLIASFGFDLGVSSGAPVVLARYNLEFSTTKNSFLGDMVLLVTEDGMLQDSYASIKSVSPPRASLIKGTYKRSNGSVKVKAEAGTGLATQDTDETIELSGKGVLNGIIGHPEKNLPNGKTAIFKLTATPVN